MTGAQFEILVDGKPQSYSDLKDVAIASAEFIKSHNPLSEVAVRNMKTGEITPVSYSRASSDAPQLRPSCLGSGIDKAARTTPSLPASGRSAASTRPAEVQTICAGSGR